MAPKKTKKTKIKNSTPSASTSSSTLSFHVVNTCLPQPLPGESYHTNPYHYYGLKNAFEAKTVDEGFYVRIDMPGVGKDTVEVSFEDKKLSFTGKAPVHSFDSAPRNYSGEITFDLEPLEVSDFKVEMKNGVLRVVLVGSGFPPNYNAASSHSSGTSPKVTVSNPFIINDVMLRHRRYKVLDPPAKYVGMYPFQLDGPKGACEMRILNDEFCFERIDMPDIGSEGLTLRMTDRTMYYGGDGVKGSEYDEDRRRYLGQFSLQCLCDCTLVGMDGEIIDGVLRIILQKKKEEGTERIGQTNNPEAGPPR